MADQDLSKLKIEKSTAVSVRRSGIRSFYWVMVVGVSLVAGFLYVKGVFTPAVEVELASVAQTYPSQAFTLLNASGYVVAQRKAAVSSKATGRLEELFVEEGSRVKEGAIIGRLENKDLVASRNQAAANLKMSKSNLEQAKAELQDSDLNYKREKELVEKGFVARSDYDAAEARYKKAVAAVGVAEASIKANAAALEGAEVALEYTFIRSPFDAVVLTKDADVGDVITPFGAAANAKAAVVTIADMNSLQVETDVSESNLEQVKINQACEIQLDAFPETRFSGIVHMVVPTADRSKATVMVKVSFLEKDGRILPEMSAKVAFLSRPIKQREEKPRTTINPAAVMVNGGKKLVFIVRGDRAIETEISLGDHIGDTVEVIGGVKAGDRVVLKPLEKLRNGGRIKVSEK